MITNSTSGTNLHEIAPGIFRINTPLPIPSGDFSFNQYLVLDDQPLLFHTGSRGLFPLVAGHRKVMPSRGCGRWASRTSRPTRTARSMNSSLPRRRRRGPASSAP